MRSSDKPVEFWQSTDNRPWWHTQHVNDVRKNVKKLPMSELRGLAEEMKGAITTLQSQVDTAGPDLLHVRELSKAMGPSALFDANRFANALSKKYDIAITDSHDLITEFDWWKSVRSALAFIRQKHSITVAEIMRRRAQDAETAIFDIKGKIKRACDYMERDEGDDVEDAFRLLIEVKERLVGVGP